MIPVEAYSEYSESERRFVQLATVRDWTQSETHDVLKVLKDVRFRLEDIRPDLLRRVSVFLLHAITSYYTPIVFYYTLLHAVTHRFIDCLLILVQHGRSPW